MRAVLALGVGGVWLGTTLVLSTLRWGSRRPLVDRLRPYSVAAPGRPRSGVWSVASLREVLAPGAEAAGAALSRALGVSEPARVRLARAHSSLTATDFRLRQAVTALLALVAAAALTAALAPPAPVALLIVVGAPLLAFLVLEQQVASASARWQRRIFLELPTVVEQLATLLSAGWSLGAAIRRVAERGRGACATDLREVVRRAQHGLTETEALTEWADRAAVDELSAVVRTLSHTRETSELGRLLTEEAAAIRREVHREAIRTIDRRAQQVWVPVTVATLLPGVILLAVPFAAAMQVYAG